MWLRRRELRLRNRLLPQILHGNYIVSSLLRSLYFTVGGSFPPENHFLAWNGYILRISGAPYSSKWNCFWEFVEHTILDKWFKFGVDWTFRSWFLASFVKQAPPTNFGSLLRTNGMDYQNVAWISLSHGSRDHVCRFLWDLEKICRKRSKKCVLKKIQNCGKSILTQMGVAYMERCVMSQGIQGKRNFNFMTYGSRVIRQNVKWAVIAPPRGRLM